MIKSLIDFYLNSVNKEMGRRFRPAIILCPGGAYSFRSDTENEYVAIRFQSCGFQVFSLKYSVNSPFPAALKELAAAVAYIRDNADALDVDPNKVFVCGFSAGGHLAGCLGTLWNSALLAADYPDKSKICPNGIILCYPVVTSGVFTHKETIDNVARGMDKAYYPLLSLEENVSPETPPMFIWHTFNDNEVPVENSIILANALREKGVSFELHIFPNGCHGLSLATDYTAVSEDHINDSAAQWFEMAVRWIKSHR